MTDRTGVESGHRPPPPPRRCRHCGQLIFISITAMVWFILTHDASVWATRCPDNADGPHEPGED